MNIRSELSKPQRHARGQAISEYQLVMFLITLIIYIAMVGDFAGSDDTSLVDAVYERQESFTRHVSEP